MTAGAAIISSVFSKQIGKGLISLQTSKSQAQNNKDIVDIKKDAILKNWDGKEEQMSGFDTAKVVGYEKQSKLAQQILEVENGITEEQYQQMTALQTELGALAEEKELIQQNLIAENEKLGISKESTLILYEDADALTDFIALNNKYEDQLNDLLYIQTKIKEISQETDADRVDALINQLQNSNIQNDKEVYEYFLKSSKEQVKYEQELGKKIQNTNEHYQKRKAIAEEVENAQKKTKQVEDQETEKEANIEIIEIPKVEFKNKTKKSIFDI